MSSSPFYPYVSCVVPLPPETARVGFDFASDCLAVEGSDGLGGAAPSWIVEASTGRLVLVGVARAEPGAYGRLRSVRGIRRPKGWWSYPVAVQLELLPWSRSKSELGLFHGARGWWAPSERHHRAYLRAAHDILGVLRGILQGPPPEWLSRLAWSPFPARPRERAGSGTKPRLPSYGAFPQVLWHLRHRNMRCSA